MNGKRLIEAATLAAEAAFPKGQVNNWIGMFRLIVPELIEAINTTKIEAETVSFSDKTQKPTKKRKA